MSVTRELMKAHLRSGAATTIILLHPKVARGQSMLLLTVHLSSPEGGAEVLRE